MTQTASTDLIIKLPAVITAENFTDEQEFEKLYAKVQEAVDKHVPDVTTRTGREAIASVAHKVARTKTALIKEGKKLTEEWRDKTKKVNAACNTIEERLDALKAQVRKPLTDWETAEEARIEGHKTRLAELIGMAKVGYGHSSAEVRGMIASLEAIDLSADRWDEYHGQASVACVDAAEHLGRLLAAAEKQEAEAEELERLRAEKAERDRQEAERLAAEKAKRDEEERAERERRAEEARKAEAERAAQQAREQAEREAAERVAAAERAAQEADERAKREVAEAKAEAERQAEAERRRVAEAKAAEEAEQRRRDADTAHRKQVNNAAAAAIVEAAGITEAKAQKVIVAIVTGIVPHVSLKY